MSSATRSNLAESEAESCLSRLALCQYQTSLSGCSPTEMLVLRCVNRSPSCLLEQTGLDDLKMTHGSLCWAFAFEARRGAEAALAGLVLLKATMCWRWTLEEAAVVCKGGMRDCLTLALGQMQGEPWHQEAVHLSRLQRQVPPLQWNRKRQDIQLEKSHCTQAPALGAEVQKAPFAEPLSRPSWRRRLLPKVAASEHAAGTERPVQLASAGIEPRHTDSASRVEQRPCCRLAENQ